MNKLVVVLTRNYSTALSVVRALGSAGYTIDLIITTRGKDVEQSKVATCSKYVREATVLTGKKNSETTDKKIIDRIKKYIGQYAAAMGGVDIVLFTGGAGENQWEERRLGLCYMSSCDYGHVYMEVYEG